MITSEFCKRMPKVELHVHLEGSIRPETVLKLAKRNGISLPADTVEGLQAWYTFRDFPHFVEVYVAVSQCIKNVDDLELVAREFLEGQAEQNILHSEVTYTASTIEKYAGIPWEDQFRALHRATEYGKKELGVTCGFVIDIVRGDPIARAMEVAESAIRGREFGVCALGLAGEERLGSLQYKRAFDLAHEAGLKVAVHAGETCGPTSILESLEVARPHRIGHGVRVVEDPVLLEKLVTLGIPFEVCPSSNVCLGVYPSLKDHPLAKLIDSGLVVTINSDDPPMFSTTLSNEYLVCVQEFSLGVSDLERLVLNAVESAFLEKSKLVGLSERAASWFKRE